jgi:hypothetical protein
MRPRIALLTGLLLAGAACANPVDDSFRALTAKEWAWRLHELPQMASGVGVHDFDDQLGHVDAKTMAARGVYLDDVLKQLKAAAKANRRSLQAEIHDVLRRANTRNLAETRRLSAKWLKRLGGSSHSDSAALIREDRNTR